MSQRRTLAKRQFTSTVRKPKRTIKKKNVNRQKKNFNANALTVTYMSNQLNPYPRRYRCKLHSQIYGSIAAGAVSATYYVRLNSCYIPFNAGGWPGAFPTIATLAPAGYSILMNAVMYQRLRVFGSKIELEFLPQALTDTVQVTVTPSETNTVPSSVDTAMSQPFTKQLFMSSSKMNSPNGSSIKNYITQNKLVGVSKQAIANDLSGSYAQRGYAQHPANLLFWVVNFTTPDKVATATALEYKCKMTWYVEMYSDTTADLPQS